MPNLMLSNIESSLCQTFVLGIVGLLFCMYLPYSGLLVLEKESFNSLTLKKNFLYFKQNVLLANSVIFLVTGK